MKRRLISLMGLTIVVAAGLFAFAVGAGVQAASDTNGLQLPTPTMGVPAAPANLEARSVGDRLQITLLWQDSSDNEDSFVVERSTAGASGPWTVVATPPADTSQYDDTGLADGVTYWYRVAAANGAGMSNYSNVAFGTATALPTPPLGDTNCDGSVSSVDATLILQLDAGLLASSPCLELGDVNGDSSIDAVDAALVLQFDAGLIDSLPAAASGIDGLVTVGPMCPVIQPGTTPCPDQPFQATIIVYDGDGLEITSVESGEDGRFQLALATGSYTLVPQSPNPGAPPTADEQPVEVHTGVFVNVTIQYDSGIR